MRGGGGVGRWVVLDVLAVVALVLVLVCGPGVDVVVDVLPRICGGGGAGRRGVWESGVEGGRVVVGVGISLSIW